jgi:hypothetical protein
MGSLIEELLRREAAARAEAEELRGRIAELAGSCGSGARSVIASSGRLTWNPSSWASRAVDSTPTLVAMPVMTTWVTPASRSVPASPVPLKALRVYLVTRMSPGRRPSSSIRSAQSSGRRWTARSRGRCGRRASRRR